MIVAATGLPRFYLSGWSRAFDEPRSTTSATGNGVIKVIVAAIDDRGMNKADVNDVGYREWRDKRIIEQNLCRDVSPA